MEDLVKLLEQVEQDHHQVYFSTDGEDPDWPRWYARRLLNSATFKRLVKEDYQADELAEVLEDLDKQYNDKSPDTDWKEFYAKKLLEK